MKSWLLQSVRMMVDHPEEVRCARLRGQTTVVYELRGHSGDTGKMIGKDGKTISALRTLVGAMAARQGRKAVVEVVD